MAEGKAIENLKKNRSVFRGAFTRNSNEIEKLFSSEMPDISEIQVIFDTLVLKFEQLRVIDNDLYMALLESATEEELQAEMESCDTYIKKYFAVKLKYDKLSKSRAEQHSTNAGSDHDSNTSNRQLPSEYNTGMRRFNLPKIEFIKYDGAIKDWLPFWNQFKKIHEDECIADSDKIEYLIQATVPGSRARRLVESFPIIGANYPKIIECMESRFGREDLQIEVYIRELLKLILTNSSSRQKMDIASLYDKIETQLRSLETLGVASDKCSAMLFPLIESCLPQELLRVWQRSSHFNIDSESNDKIVTLDDRLKKLLSFLRSEVQNEQRIDLAKEGFGLVDGLSSLNTSNKGENLCFKSESKKSVKEKGFGAPTAIGLMNAEIANCVFCSGQHESKSCFKAQKMSYDQKREILTKKKACYRCFKIGHQVQRCRGRLSCIVCQRSHETLLCPELSQRPKNNILDRNQNQTPPLPVESKKNQDLSNQTSTHVFLQTLQVTLRGSSGLKKVRALIDSGSQRSYIMKETALQLGYLPKHSEKLIHCLFGGKESPESHVCYDVIVVNDSFSFTFEALDQMVICGDVSPVFFGEWSKELSTCNIVLSDNREPGPIEVLLGADVIPSLYTGTHHKLTCGLAAIETSLGWTLTGKIPVSHVKSDVVMTSLSLFVKHASVSDLWELDVLGIQEPSDKCTREESAMAAKELFMDTISRDEEGRYEVLLPWLEGHAHVPTNFNIAKKRLDVAVHKLKNENLFDRYNDIFVEWEAEGIIERVSTTGNVHGHFLPHRPVIKENSTTQIRPVFDASSHEKDKPSLNCCLEKGLNLIELIPSVLLRFRENKLGVVSDIRRAFLQISVSTSDRNFLKFLWIDSKGQMVVYRHKRLVFGLSSSPFLLGATLEYHLSQALKKCEDGLSAYSRDTVKRLTQSFYVDNCVTSLPDETSMKTFIKEATDIMKDGCFDLRGWESTRSLGMEEEIRNNAQNNVCPVLGLNWCPEEDNLTLNASFLSDESLVKDDVVITKRYILSLAHRVFDPIGYLSPTILVPKLMLQKLWKETITWDQPVDGATAQTFKQWVKELPLLQQIKIPRWICADKDNCDELSIHTFCDASQDAYACVIFLRVTKNKHVSIHLVAAKARVAPIKKQGSKMTIPRMELLAATIGARLYEQVVKNLESQCQSYFWSDSTTVISWIQRREEWGVFVWNRVSEIRNLTSAENWHHLPGANNPADLPSRGCSPKQLLSSRWWEGPTWLYHDLEMWPLASLTCDEEEIMVERKKKLVTTALNINITDTWHLEHFSKYIKTVRMFGWIFRFIHNCQHPEEKNKDELNATELHQGETFLLKLIQKQSFSGVGDHRLKSLNPFLDEEGLIRLKSRVSNRDDKENYRFPIILPSKHFLVYNLIRDSHINSCHVGTQGLLCLLRENFWILCGRRTVRSVVTKCVICKRFNSKSMNVISPPLPLDRVRDAIAFEVTGVDFAGPLYLEDGGKAWICLFTCAVYRAVHMELVTSLSTVSFLQALRRFVARRGRPKTIFSDNGTNFVGAENAFSLLDWKTITRDTAVQQISWKFNPPTAAWWGGFWERLIGVVKQLLKKVLGRASLNYENLLTVLCDCESIVNSRPLTYVSEDPQDLVPLTPEMFLRDRSESGMPDCDLVDRNSLCRKARKLQTLREVLRSRFRAEYLGQLSLANNKISHRQIALGELVLVGNDNNRRLEWPVGRVVELLPGKDGQIRLVRVETSRGVLLRPLQRLYPLEIFTVPDPVPESQSKDDSELLTRDEVLQPDADEDREPSEMEDPREDQIEDISVPVSRPKFTKCGRVTKVPKRFL